MDADEGDERSQSAIRTQALLDRLRSRKRLLVLTHTNPDPDSMASAMGVRLLVDRKLGLPTDIALSGRVMRAENRELVRAVELKMVPYDALELGRYDAFAMVDTQPGFGHTRIPPGCPIDVVIDHHLPPPHNGHQVPHYDVRTSVGATSSMVTDYLMHAGVDVPPDVATALFYGVKTDTADLSRNASPLDVAAYEFLQTRVDRVKLARITNPDVPIEYFRALRSALNNVRFYDNVILCSLGRIEAPEMVAEVADLLLRMEGKEAVFCGGLAGKTYYVSVRTDMPDRDAYDLIRGALGGEGSFGGHGSVAGGSIEL
ncbi:MAG TPA: DHH family phosphoesterase, partial [Planctomycetota bacterium]|nr:DHH family phosphoesterase [Planctomycetota bacterium]